METKQLVTIILIAVGIVFGLFVLLLTISYADLQYYEYGFERRKISGKVNTETVYGPGGRSLVGPDVEFKPFQSDAHIVTLDKQLVFTSDRLEVTLTATFQYFLMKEELPLLHDEYDIFYQPILETNSMDAFKGAATVFSTREFIRNRLMVENALFKAIRERLGGKCCIKDCSKSGTCINGCKPYGTCTRADKGLFAEVRFFQLGRVEIPSDVEERFLKALVLSEETEKEKFFQEATVTRKKTDAEVDAIQNEAREIAANATAQSELLQSKADANAAAILEKARYDGLRLLYSQTGINTQEHKSSFDYLRTLKDQDNVHLSVDFQQLIVGPMSAGGN